MSAALLLAGMWIHSAAADPVIHTGDPVEAVERVANTTRRPRAFFEPLSWSEVQASSQPFALGEAGIVEPCTGSPRDPAVVADHVADVEAALDYLQLDQAARKLAGGFAALPCLSGPVDPAGAARLHYLHGLLIQLQTEDAQRVKAAFRRALGYVPELAWDPNYPPTALPQFEHATDELAAESAASVGFFPARTEPWRADGALVEAGSVELAPGEHILQWGTDPGVGVRVRLRAGEHLQIVDPAALEETALDWLEDPDLRPAVNGVVARSVVGETVYVVSDDLLWMGAPQTGVWGLLEELQPRTTTPPELYAAGAGAALLTTGLVWGGVAYSQGSVAAQELETPAQLSFAQFEDAERRYGNASTSLAVARLVALGGAALTGTGVYLYTRRKGSARPDARTVSR